MKLIDRIKAILILIILFVISLNTNIYATEIEKGEYSKRYEEWLKLDEEKRKNTIAPLPINIRAEEQTTTSSLYRLLRTNTIPTKYDLREHINVEVKDQMQTNSCWAFSANTMLETYLELNSKTYNFSERHLEYNTAKNFLDGTNPEALNREIGVGGYSTTAFTYYSRGSGPILEEDMPFENNENEIKVSDLPTSEPVQKVDNMIYFPTVYKTKEGQKIVYTDGAKDPYIYNDNEIKSIRNQIKEHIINYGAISASVNANSKYLNTNTGAANLNESGVYANHSVTIIGWDDNFSKDNFLANYKPTTDGAYIVLNSWGENWGTSWKEKGVYYVSYEDFLIETDMRGVTSVSDIEYDNLYQHDTSEMYSQLKVKYAANVFTAKEDEKITEVMIGTWGNQSCNIYVNKNGGGLGYLDINKLTKVASNVNLKPGYNTIKINDDIMIRKGNTFSIVVEMEGEKPCIGVEDNCGYFSNAVSNINESYVSNDGINWGDLYNLYHNTNLSIKAFTKKENDYFPKQVTGVKASSIGYEDIELSWSSQNDITEYEIYNCNTSETYCTTSNIYRISNLKEGTTYRFKVRAGKRFIGEGYYGEYSSELAVTTKARTDISKCTISGIKNKPYTGRKITQSITAKCGSKTLKNGTDYTVGYSNNKNTGKASIQITGIGAYKGTITKTFIITPEKVTGLKAKNQKTDKITITWSKITGAKGYKLYSYNYKKEKWDYVGKTSGTSYTVKKLKAGTTYKYRVRAYIETSGTQYFGSYSSSIKTSTQTKAPSISKLTTKSKKATIKWKKISGATGYEIYMATNKKGNYSKIKTITKSSTISYTKTKLKKNKRYYFKIKTYKIVDGKKIYSSYSSVKSIKIK